MFKRSVIAWKMLILSLPKGIAAFVIAVTGICVSLPLVIVWIGLPLLALTLSVCRTMMSSEQQVVEAWSNGKGGTQRQQMTGRPAGFRWEGLQTLGAGLRQGQSYRGILYSILQLPVGILAFTLTIVCSSVAFAGLLSPLAHKISLEVFTYDLNLLDPEFFFFLSDMTSAERSWIVCGIGFVMLLLLPLLLQGLGRLYAAWINNISGGQPAEVQPFEVIHTQ